LDRKEETMTDTAGRQVQLARRFISDLCQLSANHFAQIPLIDIDLAYVGSRFRAQDLLIQTESGSAGPSARLYAAALRADEGLANCTNVPPELHTLARGAVRALLTRNKLGNADFAVLYGPFEEVIPVAGLEREA
jgi:hypothetical protein